jgi:hypothetical protein
MRQVDFMGDMGSDRYSDDDDAVNYDRLEGLDGSQRGLGRQQQQQRGRPVGGGRDRGVNMQQQLGFMAEMGSDRYSDSEDDFEPARPVQPRGGKGSRGANAGGRADSSSSIDLSLLSDFADALDYIDDSSSLPLQNPNAGRSNNAAGGQGLGFSGGSQNPGKASYMDEDTMEWGRESGGGDVSMGGDEGAAAARQVLQDWQSEGQQQQQQQPYNAGFSTRSQEGLGASFEFDSAGPGLSSADSVLGQLPLLEAELGAGPQQQQQQQQQEPPATAAPAKRKSRAGTSSRRSKKTEEGTAAAPAAASSRRKTSTRKAAGDRKKQQKGSAAAAAAAAAEGPLDGWVGGADAGDEGFEEGWVDRMMDDGTDRAGIDDVMRS